MTTRLLALLLLVASLTACGVAETGAAAATIAASKAEEARRAQQLEAKVQADLDAAAKQAAERRSEADAQ